MIGVAIPAHNEEELIGACLQSAVEAARHAELHGEEVRIVVVLDACTDRSLAIAECFPVSIVRTNARSVGVARAIGAEHLLAAGARWLAFTDADTEVSPRWLVHQLALGADAVCGSVAVADWSCFGVDAERMQAHFESTYVDRDGHRHIHGANIGVAARAYIACGGFPALAQNEDVALVQALLASGASIAWSASPRVSTSARQRARAIGGFADTLRGAMAWLSPQAVLPP